ncbi:hypothetical protein N7517_003733, partial [Penicillium concentricum]
MCHCGGFWRNWTIQSGDNLQDVIDPRGVVEWECRSNPNNTTLNDDRALKGYKVRTWRVWGESGKEYHRQVNARGKAEKGEFADRKKKGKALDDAPVEIENMENVTEVGKHDLEYSQTGCSSPPYSAAPHTAILQPAVAKEAVRIRQHRVFTPSFVCRKFGQLWIFDSAVSKLLDEDHSPAWNEQAAASELRNVRKTRLYELIMTTAMCMIIGEREKRNTLLLLLIIAAAGG